MTPLTLALNDGWTIGMFAVNLVFNAVLAIALMYVRQSAAKVGSLQHNLEQRAEQLIESKLTGVATHLEGVINVVNERVSNIRERLAAGDDSFSDLDKRDRELETRFALRFDQLKDYLHKNFATKEDTVVLHKRIDTLKQQGLN